MDLENKEKIPKSMYSIYGDLTQENSERRPNPADIIVRGRKPGGFFKNDLVDSLLFLEEIQIKEQVDKNRFFNGLTLVLDKFPDEICKHKILPQLINAFEFGNAGSAVLAPLFKVRKKSLFSKIKFFLKNICKTRIYFYIAARKTFK